MDVFADNLALGKTARQISTFLSPARAAVDDDFTTAACTDDDKAYPWWSVDLGQVYHINSITITSTDNPAYGMHRPSCALH